MKTGAAANVSMPAGEEDKQVMVDDYQQPQVANTKTTVLLSKGSSSNHVDNDKNGTINNR